MPCFYRAVLENESSSNFRLTNNQRVTVYELCSTFCTPEESHSKAMFAKNCYSSKQKQNVASNTEINFDCGNTNDET